MTQPGNTTAQPNLSRTEHLHKVRRVFLLTLWLNLAVALSEIGWGFYTHVLSLEADGFHSLLDAASNVIGIIALSISARPADSGHPYGHRKFETMAAMGISFFIFLTFFEIANGAIRDIFSGGGHLPFVNPISYAIKGVGLAINIFVNRYESRKGRELRSELLLADAQHTYSDILVSLSVLVSLVAVQMNVLWMDTVVALIIACIVLRVGFGIIMLHMGALVDEAVLDPAEVSKVVLSVPGVRGCHQIRSRGLPDHVFIDLHIQVDGALSITEAHRISYDVEQRLFEAYQGSLADVLVHVEEESHEVHPETSPLV